jgi:glycosyltransferase involved in cell wall biosynthesis
VETHVARLASGLAARGCGIDVLTQAQTPADAGRSRDGDVEVLRFPRVVRSDHYPIAPGLWRFLRCHRGGYDIVHAHNYHALPSLAAALVDHPGFVFTPHYHGTGHSPIARALHVPYRLPGSAIFRRARRVLCVSHAEAALVRSDFPAAARKTEVIPNGVDLEAIEAAEPFASERHVVLSAGRLETYKRVDVLIEAMRSLDERYELRVLGDGPHAAELRRVRDRLGLEARVTFMGRVTRGELLRWLKTASTFVSLSANEAFGIAAAEGLAAGAGLVVSDIPAHRELAPSPGALVPLDAAPQAVATAIERNGRTSAATVAEGTLLSWDDVAERVLDQYALAAGDSTTARVA